MKSYKKIAIIFTALGTFAAPGCKKILDQEPKANITPNVLASQGGVVGGIAGVYSDLRNLWGTEGFFYYTNLGVDETLAGGGASSSGSNFATYKNYTTDNL